MTRTQTARAGRQPIRRSQPSAGTSVATKSRHANRRKADRSGAKLSAPDAIEASPEGFPAGADWSVACHVSRHNPSATAGSGGARLPDSAAEDVGYCGERLEVRGVCCASTEVASVAQRGGEGELVTDALSAQHPEAELLLDPLG
jgi:hypothetical protein